LEAIAPLFVHTAPVPDSKLPGSMLFVPFLEIAQDLDQEKLFGFLVERKALAVGRPLNETDEAFLRKVLDNPAGFKQAVTNYGNDKTKAANLPA
jgi:hypothetical protein